MSDIAYLTVAEVADRFRVTPTAVRRWIKRKELRAVIVGGTTVRVPMSEIERIEAPADESDQSDESPVRVAHG